MLSIVIPCYNSSEILKRQLPLFIEYLKNKSLTYEIIVVDDGSQDSEMIKKIVEHNGATYLKNQRNLGKGASVRKGMLHAKGEYRIFTDVDIPFEYDAIERFFYYLDFKEFDIVIGDRKLAQSVYFKKIPLIRRIGSHFMSFIIGSFITSGFFDTQCGIKGFSAKAAENIFNRSLINGFAFDVEILYIALKKNYDIKRLSVVLRCNESDSVKIIRDGMQMLVDVFRIKYNHTRGRYN